MLDHQRRRSPWYTVMAVTDPDKGANGISAFVVHADDPGFVVGTKERKLGHQGLADQGDPLRELPDPGDRIIGEPGTGFKTAMAHPRPHPADDRRAGGRHRAGRARCGDRLHQGAQAVRQDARRVPGPAVHDRRHGDEDRGRAAAGLPGGGARRARRADNPASCRRRRSAAPPTWP